MYYTLIYDFMDTSLNEEGEEGELSSLKDVNAGLNQMKLVHIMLFWSSLKVLEFTSVTDEKYWKDNSVVNSSMSINFFSVKQNTQRNYYVYAESLLLLFSLLGPRRNK